MNDISAIADPAVPVRGMEKALASGDIAIAPPLHVHPAIIDLSIKVPSCWPSFDHYDDIRLYVTCPPEPAKILSQLSKNYDEISRIDKLIQDRSDLRKLALEMVTSVGGAPISPIKSVSTVTLRQQSLELEGASEALLTLYNEMMEFLAFELDEKVEQKIWELRADLDTWTHVEYGEVVGNDHELFTWAGCFVMLQIISYWPKELMAYYHITNRGDDGEIRKWCAIKFQEYNKMELKELFNRGMVPEIGGNHA